MAAASPSSAERATSVLVLAAGQGTRMKSRRAKVLHEIAGRSMLGHVLSTAEDFGAARLIVVVGRDAEQVQENFAGRAEFVLQAEQRGTGHAVLQTQAKLSGFEGDVLVLYGDTPLLRAESLEALRALKQRSGAGLAMLTSPEPLPGLVVRDPSGKVARIVERPDATPEELKIQEGNTGVYLMDSTLLWDALAQVDDQNAQGEIYLTDVVQYAVEHGHGVAAMKLEDPDECLGVNNRAELAAAAAVVRARKNRELMDAGVSFVDPAQAYIDVDVEIGRDSLIEPGCVISGASVLGEGVHLKAACTIEESQIGDDCVIGPNAHLRPDSKLGAKCRIGNFVEVKNSTLGDGCKVDHLSYVGDADVGEGSSFGCGSITVNYDWLKKHRTTLGRGCKVGCNANLVAPIVLGDRAHVAAGSTLGDDVPAGALAVARADQRNFEGWVARRLDGAGDGRTVRAAAASKPRASRGSAARKKAVRTKTTRKKAAKPASKKKSAKKKSAKKKSAKKKTGAKKAAAKSSKKRPAKKAARKKASRARRAR